MPHEVSQEHYGRLLTAPGSIAINYNHFIFMADGLVEVRLAVNWKKLVSYTLDAEVFSLGGKPK